MKIYNLVAGTLSDTIGDEPCHCVLGIYLEERSVDSRNLLSGYLLLREKHADDMKKMADHMYLAIGDYDKLSYARAEGNWLEYVYGVNDAKDPDSRQPVFPVDVIKGALNAVGVDVEINDRRELEF